MPGPLRDDHDQDLAIEPNMAMRTASVAKESFFNMWVSFRLVAYQTSSGTRRNVIAACRRDVPGPWKIVSKCIIASRRPPAGSHDHALPAAAVGPQDILFDEVNGMLRSRALLRGVMQARVALRRIGSAAGSCKPRYQSVDRRQDAKRRQTDTVETFPVPGQALPGGGSAVERPARRRVAGSSRLSADS